MQAINTGSSRDGIIQKCLRELHKVVALSHCELRAVYLSSQDNRISDALSRWHLNDKFEAQFFNCTKQFNNKKEVKVTDELWAFVMEDL